MKITIIACGWLGLPLGEYLSKKANDIKGSATTIDKIEKLERAGIKPFLLKINPEIDCENFDELIDSESIIINIPPRIAKHGADFHFMQIENLSREIKKKYVQNSPNIIFISSTSVYPDANQTASEISVVSDSHVLIKVENLLKSQFEKTTILRLGGLMGYDRFPGKYYAGKLVENWATGVNYIHRDDAIQIIEHVLKNNIWNETFNICSPIHPSRAEILQKNCDELGLELPIFTENPTSTPFKIIDPNKFINQTGYQFKYPNPLDFVYKNP